MNSIKKYILAAIAVFFNAIVVFGQLPDTVCVGAEVYYKIEAPDETSTYHWGIYNNSGTITTENQTDSITIVWDTTSGVDSIWVVEQAATGCTGDTAKLTVIRKPLPNATFQKDLVCYGEFLNIQFTGEPPFVIKIKKGEETANYTFESEAVNFETNPGNYEILKINDKFCSKSELTGITTAIITKPLTPIIILHE